MRSALITAALIGFASVPVSAQGISADFVNILAETGCESRYTEDKRADLFATKYKNKEMTVFGEVSTGRGELSLKILRKTLTSDLHVKLVDPNSAYDLYQVPLIRTHVPIGVIRWT